VLCSHLPPAQDLMKRCCYAWSWLTCGCAVVTAVTVTQSALAQVIPDDTLPVGERSLVSGGSVMQINGGATRGANLFHSFREFSLATGSTAAFNNALGIQTIFARVTGGIPSQIDGTLQANGIANLFFINPSGILFGPNAQLAIGGSFIASTANSIGFSDGTQFRAVNPQPSDLLSINVPLGLQMGAAPGKLINQSRATDGTGAIVGLKVPTGNTLALIGGEIDLAGGSLTAPQGQIELGSVANGTVGLIQTGATFTAQYDTIQTWREMRLFDRAIVNASGIGGGTIHITGGTISLSDSSSIIADTLGNLNGGGISVNAQNLDINSGAFIGAATLGSGNGGSITIRAIDSINITGFGFEDYQTVYVLPALTNSTNVLVRQNGIFGGAQTNGRSGAITIQTRDLRLQEGGLILNINFGSANNNNVAIDASESVVINGSAISGGAVGSAGNASNLTLNTKRLTLLEGGALSTATLNGSGAGGDMVINASEFIDLLGTPPNALLGTTIATLSFRVLPGGTTGNAGNITIHTGRLRILDGSLVLASSGGILNGQPLPGGKGGQLSIRATDIEIAGMAVVPAGRFLSRLGTETTSAFPAGELTIDTQRLTVRDGGTISAFTLGKGNAGNISIRAREQMTVRGVAPDGMSASGVFASAGSAAFQQTGRSGDLTIVTPQLSVQNGAEIAVNSFGMAPAGSLSVTANTITLDNQATITAATASGEGGNINLTAKDYVLLRRNSLISAEAGGTGNGGNITINAGFVVANLTENSDIRASAFAGTGGNIRISAQGIFGLQFQREDTPNSDISASSRFGVDGVVQLNTPNIDPSRGITSLPSAIVDTNSLIANSCIARSSRQGNFVVTGTGGLPTRPDDPSAAPFATYELAQTQPNMPPPSSTPPPDSAISIVEIDGIYQLGNGQIVLGRSCQ
jgi:filamentous hemagglutinin family protein